MITASMIELVANLILPLFTKVRQADDSETFDFPPLQKLADDQKRFHCFTDADVIRDQEANRSCRRAMMSGTI